MNPLRHINKKYRSGQTAVELGVFGAILIFVLGLIVQQGLNFSHQQNQQLKAMRAAMTLSYRNAEGLAGGGGGDGNASHNSASVLLIEDRLSAGSSKYGETDRVPLITQGSATHSRNLFLPTDVREPYNIPVLDVIINGHHFPFQVAGYKTGIPVSVEACIAACESTAVNANTGQSYFNFKEANDACSVFPTYQRADLIATDIYLNCSPDPYDDLGFTTCDGFSCGGLGVCPCTDTVCIDAQLANIAIGGSCFDPTFASSLSPRSYYTKEANLPGSDFNEDCVECFDIDRGVTDVFNPPPLLPGIDPCPATVLGVDVVDVDRPTFFWQWKKVGLREGTSVDIDCDLKEERVITVNGNEAHVLDFQEGDIDLSVNPADPGYTVLLAPGLQEDSQMVTQINDGTYLLIEEGNLYSTSKEYIRTVSKKDSVDIMTRFIRLSNDTGRFCSSGVPQPLVDGFDNPVEVCCAGCCFDSGNIDKVCMDTADLLIFVRSRVEDRHGRKWITDKSTDPFVNFTVPVAPAP